MIFKSYLVEKNIQILNKNLILFYGENLGIKNQIKKDIRLNETTEVIIFSQDEILRNKEIFFSELFNISLFEKKKIFFINESNDKILSIINEIEEKIDTQKIYLFSDVLDKKSKLRNYFEKSNQTIAIACYMDNEITLKKIITEKLKNFTGLSPENINIIFENCNLDREKLNNELNKIITFFNNKLLEKEKLELLLNMQTNENFNNLKDEAIVGNKVKTNKLISETFLESDKKILYLNIINQRLTKLLALLQMKKTVSLDEAINNIKPPIFWKDKAIFNLQAKKWNIARIKKTLNKTYDLELKIKSNSLIDHKLLIKKLLVDICSLANA
tara:strand:+ start:3847 stop:4833 length:987 start_codon:yes stop_codon:yes gene_type:complete